MTATDIDLVEVRDSAVARGDGDVLELDVHVVFGFQELAPVDLPRRQFERYHVALLEFSDEGIRGRMRGVKLTWASFNSLMGMPMVEVSLPMVG